MRWIYREISSSHREVIEECVMLCVYLFGYHGNCMNFSEVKCTNWANKNIFNESWPGIFINGTLCVKLFIRPSSVKHKTIFFILEKINQRKRNSELNSTILTWCTDVKGKLTHVATYKILNSISLIEFFFCVVRIK